MHTAFIKGTHWPDFLEEALMRAGFQVARIEDSPPPDYLEVAALLCLEVQDDQDTGCPELEDYPWLPVILLQLENQNLPKCPGRLRGVFNRTALTQDTLAPVLAQCQKDRDRLNTFWERQNLRRQNRMLEEPIARVIHDLNNQFTGLKGGMDLLSMSLDAMVDPELRQKCRRYLDQFIQPSLDQVEQMVANWRAIRSARLEDTQPCSLLPLLVRSVEMTLPPACRKRVQWHLEEKKCPWADLTADPQKWEVCVAPSSFMLAMAQVVLNAVEAVVDLPNGQILVAVKSREGGVDIGIADNGPGIPEVDRMEIWKAFFSRKGGEHNGMGLSIAKQIIDKFQGQIEALEPEEKGGYIRIHLPSADKVELPSKGFLIG